MVVFDKSRESQKMKKNGRHGDNSCLPLYKLTQRYALRRGQRFDHIRHSGADIGIHEEGGVLFRAFFRLGQFQAGHSQTGIQRELLEKIRILIANAFEKGTFSASIECGWPTCIWAVTEDGQIAEAHRGTRGSGKYHGYPSKLTNDFENEILKRWNAQ